ncbi:hypothetical protein Sya03_45570 [Spirilliplanes yamanashiensis]|uniref:Uncharacterized protein n=1 Tax=Spirilliplanes yamanashiensis TaxID=42233 RepID=A0A8J4DLL3_9ACTN|nr:hypothetical protein [Spirilliplanes yamanashiensis]GIJ05205.1 hypothetical protein Sya03_45570 [Spirilliplanes yamanashiensis]
MSSEPLATTPADTAASADRGLLIAVLLMVLAGVAGMFMI